MTGLSRSTIVITNRDRVRDVSARTASVESLTAVFSESATAVATVSLLVCPRSCNRDIMLSAAALFTESATSCAIESRAAVAVSPSNFSTDVGKSCVVASADCFAVLQLWQIHRTTTKDAIYIKILFNFQFAEIRCKIKEIPLHLHNIDTNYCYNASAATPI